MILFKTKYNTEWFIALTTYVPGLLMLLVFVTNNTSFCRMQLLVRW